MFWRRNEDEAATTPEERTRELLSAYRDGELSASEEAQAVALLERDPAARAEFDDLDLLVSALGSLGAEVSAPRSFAIPAGAAAAPAPRTPLVLFRRVEIAFRASAAAAALLFVFVLVGNPAGDRSVSTQMSSTESSAAESSATMAELSPMSAETPAGEASGPADTARSAGGATLAPASAPEPDSTPEAGGIGGGLAESTEGSGADGPRGGESAGDGVQASESTLKEPAPPAAPASAVAPDEAGNAAGGLAFAAEDSASGTDVKADPMPGTFMEPASSDGVGGMAAGLGTIAGLLTALSALLAWNRRTATMRSSSDR